MSSHILKKVQQLLICMTCLCCSNVENQLQMRFMKFLHSAIHSKNKCVANCTCAKLTVYAYGSHLNVYSSLNNIAHRNGLINSERLSKKKLYATLVHSAANKQKHLGTFVPLC